MANQYIFDAQELEAFRQAQRLSYDCVTHVEQRLEPGMTERDVCRLMDEYLHLWVLNSDS